MNKELFINEVKDSCLRSERVLLKKEPEYTIDGDRLGHFKRAGAAQNKNPADALVGEAVKHFISVCDMSKNPTYYSLKQWREKTTDLRNYTLLLDALLKDLGVV